MTICCIPLMIVYCMYTIHQVIGHIAVFILFVIFDYIDLARTYTEAVTPAPLYLASLSILAMCPRASTRSLVLQIISLCLKRYRSSGSWPSTTGAFTRIQFLYVIPSSIRGGREDEQRHRSRCVIQEEDQQTMRETKTFMLYEVNTCKLW